MAYGKKKFKRDQYARCDGCGKRTYQEAERVYQWPIYAAFVSVCACTGVLCVECDYNGLCEQITRKMIIAEQIQTHLALADQFIE